VKYLKQNYQIKQRITINEIIKQLFIQISKEFKQAMIIFVCIDSNFKHHE